MPRVHHPPPGHGRPRPTAPASRRLAARRLMGAAVMVGTLLLGGCLDLQQTDLETIRQRGTLRILTRNSPTTYYENQDHSEGFERDLGVAFAEYLGVVPRFVVKESTQDLLNGLRRGEGDLVAAGLPRLAEWGGEFRFGPTYHQVEQHLVCHRHIPPPQDLLDLAGHTLVVGTDNGSAARLEELTGLVPNLTWRTDPERSTEQILEQVAEGAVTCTVAPSDVVAVNQHLLPGLAAIFPISAPREVAWLLPRHSRALQYKVEEWLAVMRRSGRLAALVEAHFGGGLRQTVDLVAQESSDPDGMASLPPWLKHLFLKAAEETGFPWTLLAAMAYQESRWDADAVSPDGARGVMMLTERTATLMGVRDRDNAVQSIQAGANYLKRIHGRLTQKIPEPDRLWVAVAAYNVGIGHISDARRLARSLGLDANSWRAMQEVLPLLSQRVHYTSLTHGYAQGSRTVHYVAQVRKFQGILERREPPVEEVSPSGSGVAAASGGAARGGGVTPPLETRSSPLSGLESRSGPMGGGGGLLPTVAPRERLPAREQDPAAGMSALAPTSPAPALLENR